MTETEAVNFLKTSRKGTILQTEIEDFDGTQIMVNVIYNGNIITTGRCPMKSVKDKTMDFEKDLVIALGTYYHNDPEYFKQESALFSA